MTKNPQKLSMEDNKIVHKVEKVKAGALAFIGAGFFSQGIIYFQEQSSYHIPRILYPFYKLFGHIGLAVAMLVLGLVLIYWGYTKWKKHDGKIGIFASIAVISFIAFFAILSFTGTKKTTTEELIKKSDETRAKGIEKMKEMDEPDLSSDEVKQHFANFYSILKQREDAKKNEDQVAQKKVEDAYNAWTEKSAVLIQKLDTPEQKQQFALYVGKLTLKWQEVKPVKP